ncbi:calumenin-A-like [Amphiura filiformis]|uniref:calumenin-A-like n=1 Tax=Amphiura filiformis TaxID=82378 RepID=UPI003B225798
MQTFQIICCVLVGMLSLTGARREKPDTPSPDADHYDDGTHNEEYDHEVFLGGEKAAKEFEVLTEEESKRRLTVILKKVDTNSDTFIDKEELTNWVVGSLKKIDNYNAEERLKVQDRNGDGKLTWEEYNLHVFGYMPAKGHDTKSEYGKDVKRAERTFNVADKNQDGFLDSEEYLSFNNPRAVKEMEPIVIEQLLDNMDWNHDGAVALDEFLGDYFNVPGTNQAPAWVAEESELFRTQLDKNGDGYLRSSELFDWVRPDYAATAQFEADHLIKQADANKDGMLTEEEVLNKYRIFAGSRATHFGRHIRDKTFVHEEL